jgi:hypothetical protein
LPVSSSDPAFQSIGCSQLQEFFTADSDSPQGPSCAAIDHHVPHSPVLAVSTEPDGFICDRALLKRPIPPCFQDASWKFNATTWIKVEGTTTFDPATKYGGSTIKPPENTMHDKSICESNRSRDRAMRAWTWNWYHEALRAGFIAPPYQPSTENMKCLQSFFHAGLSPVDAAHICFAPKH